MAQPIFFYATDQGDGTGDISYVGDYSVTPKTLYLEGGAVGSGSRIMLHRMVVSVEDNSGMTATEYGNLGDTLDNGIQFKVIRKGSDQNMFPQVAIKDNSGWGHVCYDVDVKSWGGGQPTNDVLVVRWTFSKAGSPIKLNAGDQFQIILSDDFTGLVHQQFHLHGVDLGKNG